MRPKKYQLTTKCAKFVSFAWEGLMADSVLVSWLAW
jgi:hypothetical protein